MVKEIFIFVWVLLLFPKVIQAQNNPEPHYVNYEIKNTELKSEIKGYIDSVDKYNDVDKAIFVTVHIQENSTKYYISYRFTPNEVGNPIHQITQIQNVLVIFSIAGFNGGTVKECILIKMAKNHFRRKYEYYIKNDRWPIPTTYDAVPSLVLTFKNDQLIKKEKVYY